jgi:uroporphyrinogen-III synthase
VTTTAPHPPARICITRDIDRAGWNACVVLEPAPLTDPTALVRAAARLDTFDWLVCASPRAVRALREHRGTARWPGRLRTAAVGAATARALTEAGAVTPPVTGAGDGAAALWTGLAGAADWARQRVLVLTTPGGLTVLTEHLLAAGAEVTVADAYVMRPRAADAIRRDWHTAQPDALVVTSPRAASALVEAIGAATLTSRRDWAATDAGAVRVIAIGHTTSARLHELGIAHEVAPHADFDRLAPWLEARLATTGASR